MHTEFVSMYYNDKLDVFIHIFGKYIHPFMKEIYHPALIQEWELNLDTAAYLKKFDQKTDLRQRKINLSAR